MTDDIEAIIQVAFHGLIAAFVAWLLFGLGSRSVTGGFRIFPAARAEWVAFWFHTVEFILFCAALVAFHPAAHYMTYIGAELLFTVAVAAAFLLLASAVAFWRSDRTLCTGALSWSLISLVLLFLFFPAINAVKER